MATASDTPGIVTHLTAAERAARGKAARNRASLASHGEWSAAPDRPDPVALLEEQAATRVPELVPIRYGRMLASPFAFFRGARVPDGRRPRRRPAHRAARCSSAATRTSPTSAASPRPSGASSSASTTSTRRCPGPFEWDVKRLVASFAVAGRQLGLDEGGAATRRPRGRRRYRSAMAAFAAMTALEVWYARLDVDRSARASRGGPKRKGARMLQKTIEKAQHEGQHEGPREADQRSSTASDASSATRR